MEEVKPLQIFVRNDKGKIWGPLTPATVELLFDNGAIDGKVQVSLDGSNYVFPGRMPNIRVFVPRALWGEVVVPGDDIAHPPPPPPVPGAAPPGAAAAMAGQGGVRAGPGAVMNAAARNAAAMAGPGARAQMDKRFAPNMGTPVLKPAPGAGPPVVTPAAHAPPPPAPAAAPQAPPVVHAPPPAHAPPPPVPAIPEGTIPASGDLAQIPPLHLYYLIASTDTTGLLTLKVTDRELRIHFRKGNPEHVDSTHNDDALATFLVKAQLATFDQLGQAEQQKAKFGGELVGALFGLGILNPSTAFTHLGSRASGILFRALVAEAGSFHFEPVDLPAHKAIPLGNRWAVLAEQLRRLPAGEVRRRMAPFADHPVMKSGGRVASDQLRLTPQEARALSYFDGVHSLAQLASAHPAEADHFFRVAWMLKDLEAVSFAAVTLAAPEQEAEVLEATVDVEPSAAPTPPAPPPHEAVATPPPAAAPRPPPPVVTAAAPAASPRPPPPAASTVPGPPPAVSAPKPSGPPRPVGSPGNRPPPPMLKPAAGAPPPPTLKPAAPAAPAAAIAPPPALRTPTGPLVRNAPAPSAPRGHTGEFDGEIRQLQETLTTMKKQNFFEVFGLTPKADAGTIKIAYFKLAKIYHPDTVPPGAPEAYAKVKADIFARIGEANRTLVDEKTRNDYIADLEAGGSGGDKIDVAQILAAEEMFQKGMILVKARKYPEALKMLDDAIKGNPEEGEFYAWRAYAKFASSSDRKVGAAEAAKDFAICNRRNPRCAALWYYQGQVAKLTGDTHTAKRHFQKTVELQPDHIDAQRELRMMK